MNQKLEFLRKKNLKEAIGHPDSVELIIKVAPGKRNYLLKELDQIGQITHELESIPYISFKCDSFDAASIYRVFSKVSDRKAYSKIASSISAIDISNKFSIPKNIKEDSAQSLDCWNLEQIGAYKARKISSGEGIEVAVIDTGINYNHPEISRNFESNKGYDFVDQNSDPMDQNGHGTHVAGVIAGDQYGIANNCRLYSLRVLDEDGYGVESDTLAAFDWAAKKNVDVINVSLGSECASSALEEMCYYTANKGILIAAAAGNNYVGPSYPAAFDDPVIGVAAVDSDKNHAEFSNIWETNDISAPGVKIKSAYEDDYSVLSGTSMACPHVSGGLALAISALGRKEELESILESTAEHLEKGNSPERDVYGAGLIRIDRMVEKAAASNGKHSENYFKDLINPNWKKSKNTQQAKGYLEEVLEALREVFLE